MPKREPGYCCHRNIEHFQKPSCSTLADSISTHRNAGWPQRRDGESKMRIFKDVFYLFPPPLFANPSSCSCSGKPGRKNGGQENEKVEQPSACGSGSDRTILAMIKRSRITKTRQLCVHSPVAIPELALGGSRATGSELKIAPRSPNRRKPLENQGFNAKSRERSLSAFCVNWLTGSFRAKNLSSPDQP
jgi:hypothetical protein